MDFRAVSFYKYVHIENGDEFTLSHLAYCKEIGVFGRILIADEGINGQLSGMAAVCDRYMTDLRHDPRFADVDFKIDECEKPAFSKIHVRYRPEIVHSGLTGIDPSTFTGKHLSASEFKQLKNQENVVVLDVRSNYETHIGKFRGARTLDLENFRDFPSKLSELEDIKNKTVITYCTGGIKCEKASAFLLKNGFKDVFQLDGGILKYAREAGGEDFEGKCYVFDGRVVVDVNKVNPTLISTCIHCDQPSARIINCVNELCNEQIVICESCGWEWDGACSEYCKSKAERAYNGTGYYTRS